MARTRPEPEEDDLSFEAAMSQLEQIVRRLEGNTLGLDDALQEYSKAVERIKLCQKQLNTARRKIEKLKGITGRGEAVTETWEDDDLDSNR